MLNNSTGCFIYFRILATRITELEKRLEGTSDNEERVSLFPSKVFLETYCSSEVDTYDINTQEAEIPNGEAIPEISQIPPEPLTEEESHQVEVDLKVLETKRSKRRKEVPDNQKKITNGEAIKKELSIKKTEEKEDGNLPPELQKLVQEAHNDIDFKENQNQ